MLQWFPRQLYLAVSDFNFYKRVFDQPIRPTLLFLLYISASLAVFLTLLNAWIYNPSLNRFFLWAEDNLPELTVVDGQLEISTDQPMVLEYRDGSTLTLVFDTTGVYRDLEAFDDPAILFAKDRLTFQFEGQSNTYAWEDVGDLSINRDNLQDYKSVVQWLYFPMAYCGLLVFHLVAKLVQALILSPLAYSVGLSYGVRLTLKNALTIGLYSLAPAIIIDLAVRLTGVSMSCFDLIYMAIAAIYTFLATQRCVLIE